MEPFILDLVPNEKNDLLKSSHKGEEFIYVLLVVTLQICFVI